jgi:gliding motility-associated-like protein
LNTYIIDIDQLPTGTITSISDTTICNGGQVKLRVNLTGASKWTLVYNENSELKTVSNILSSDTIISATPGATASMTLFNYSINSLTDNNGCVATSLTGTRKANVYRVPVANAGPDDQVCGPEYTLSAVPSDGTGTWTFPAQVVSSVAGDPYTTVKIDSSFTTSSVSYKFYWEEINWQCRSKDSVTISFFNRIDTISAGRDSAFMSFDYLVKLNAYPIQPYESGKWSVVAGSGDFDDDTKNVTEVRNISLGLNTYKWKVTNGPCLLEDLVNMDVNSVVIPEAISPNGDNINDSLIISGLDLANQEAELTIVNGTGTMVFSTSNRGNSSWKNWDGKNSQGVELPEGTYYYLLKVISVKTGLVVPNSGFIILKRN